MQFREEMIKVFHQVLRGEIEKAKIAPLAKAYNMKAVGPKTFVKEYNGLVAYLNFVGYFRVGGFEAMQVYLCPTYAIETEILNLSADVLYSSRCKEMTYNWRDIQYALRAVSVEKII